MAFDQNTRNRLQKFVSDARTLLSEEFTRQLQNEYGMDPANGEVADLEKLTHLDDARRETARLLRATLHHYPAAAPSGNAREVMERIVREQAFTVINRLCALRMAESRGLLLESIGNGYNSKGFQLYARLAGATLGETGETYRCYLFSLFDEFAIDLPVLFDRYSPMGRLFPGEATLLALLDNINAPEIAPLWAEDETIGWIYQYFNPVEERRQMRKKSQAPRNSRELAVRNQFFTPRYVVEFLTDNTLGRIWYEMTQGDTSLKDSCHYLVRRPNETFLKKGEDANSPPGRGQEWVNSPLEGGQGGVKDVPEQDKTPEPTPNPSQDGNTDLLNQPVYIPFRPLKDPREIRMLDPACGSMHFGLYAFDLFERIYEEAWELEETSPPAPLLRGEGSNEDVIARSAATKQSRSDTLRPLHETYDSKEEFLRDVPRLIIEHNIHGVDIDPRAVQIAGLSLWLRAQRSWQQQGVKPADRPAIRKSNIVCAEPMPGEQDMLREFTETLKPKVLGQLVAIIFKKMELAGEAGSLLKIGEEIEDAVAQAREEFNKELLRRKEAEQDLFPDMLPPKQTSLFDFADLPDKTRFWHTAEEKILNALQDYAEQAEAGQAFRRRLFADDAAKGFAFIDLCRKRFDVVLMNPPFGEIPEKAIDYLRSRFPMLSENLYCGFITRASELGFNDAIIGAITDRSYLIKQSFENFRKMLIEGKRPVCVIDLGWGVLDANVETSVAIFRKLSGFTLFADIGKEGTQKKQEIYSLSSLKKAWKYEPLETFLNIPFTAFAYSMPTWMRHCYFDSNNRIDKSLCYVVRGMTGADADRLYRFIFDRTYANNAY